MSGRGGEAAASFGPPPAPPLRSTAAGLRAHAPPAALTHPGGTAAPGRGDNFNPLSGLIPPPARDTGPQARRREGSGAAFGAPLGL